MTCRTSDVEPRETQPSPDRGSTCSRANELLTRDDPEYGHELADPDATDGLQASWIGDDVPRDPRPVKWPPRQAGLD